MYNNTTEYTHTRYATQWPIPVGMYIVRIAKTTGQKINGLILWFR